MIFLLGDKTAKPVEAIKLSSAISKKAIAFKYVLTVDNIVSPDFTILLALEGAFSNVISSGSLSRPLKVTFPISTYFSK